MDPIKQNLYITFSNQKVRALKRSGSLQSFDKVITLSELIFDTFEQNNFKTIIDSNLGGAIIGHIVKKESIDYFSYLNIGDDSFNVIFDFIVKCHRNSISFEQMLSGDKLQALLQIGTAYESFKQSHYLADIGDVEHSTLEAWNNNVFSIYETVYLDAFKIGDIDFTESKPQEALLKKIRGISSSMGKVVGVNETKLIKPTQAVFDNIDEIKTALKIVRKLMARGESPSDILIVASDIAEGCNLKNTNFIFIINKILS